MSSPRPRRRISSRTKKRCRNIKNFLCKALSTKSETNNKNCSSLQRGISNLNEKISEIETQLDKISKHCYSSIQTNDSADRKTQQTLTEFKTSDIATHRRSISNETKILYKATSSKYGKSDGSDNTSRRKVKNNMIMINKESKSNQDVKKSKRHKANEVCKEENDFHRHKKLAAQHLAIIQNLNTTKDERKRRHQTKEYQRTIKTEKIQKQSQRNEGPRGFDRSPFNFERSRRKDVVIDEDYISNIIKKQYRPTKIFGPQHSNISQISAPVCRDKEYSMREKICYDYDLCSCCFDQPRRHDYKKINSNVSEMRSVCDARIYSSKKRSRYGQPKGLDDYNNADYYDLIPVREKSSPKARKRIDYKSIAQNKYNEVPPSPRTLRPRLNLQAKMYDESYDISHNSFTNVQEASNSTFDNRVDKNKNLKTGMSRLNLENVRSLDENANKSKQSTETDRNLTEIKDLLQSFLTVINRNSGHGENDTKLNGFSDTSNYQANGNNNSVGNAFPAFTAAVPPIMPIFPNSCCYPMMPIYPANYLQNGYLYPNVSNTCHSKTSKRIKRSSSMCDQMRNNSNSATHELLKEIHELVTQNPTTVKKDYLRPKRQQHFMTRSVGNSSIGSNKVIEDTKRCVSKSCEALACGDCNLYSNASFSDTVLEKLSIEATRSTIDFNPTFQTREIKTNKVKNFFNPWKWGKKKDDLEEISEVECVIEEDIERKPPPFRQNITNYAMYRQEYYNSPPVKRQPQIIPNQSTPIMSPQITPRRDARHYSPYYTDHPKNPSYRYDDSQAVPYRRYHPEGPMPQLPLCLKEIEVKSTGMQSERKMSLFKKFTRKVKVESETTENNKPPTKAKSGIFNWRTLKESAKTGAIPKDFSLKTQQQLAQRDTKMKNALIKKLFYKRNPFSPRNLIVKTLLGNDPSSYGNPPKLMRPKYFF